MQNNNLKYLKHKTFQPLPPQTWQNFNECSQDLNFEKRNQLKFRILYKPSSTNSTPSYFLNKNLILAEDESEFSSYHLFCSIKSLACVEQHFFDGEKIRFDKLQKMWIIPINISLLTYLSFRKIKNLQFFIDDICNYHHSKTCKCALDDGTFIVQFQQDCIISDSLRLDNDISYSNCLNEIDFPRSILFSIIWIQEFSTFTHCKYKYYDKENNYKEIILKKSDLKLVKIYDKEAIIFPTINLISFSELKHLIKTLDYGEQDLIDFSNFNNNKIPNIQLFFTDNQMKIQCDTIFF